MEHRPWDLMAICYGGIEYFSHAFMKYLPPRQETVSPEEFALFQHVVPACYRFHDRMLGRLLELAGDETTVILVSDHGFKSGSMRPPGNANARGDVEAWHRRLGVFVMRSPFIRAGSKITGASVLDITPTILTLFGLPLGRDMEGRPRLEVFHADVEPAYVETWDRVPGESGLHPAASEMPTHELHAMLQQLAEMGYNDPREEQLAAMEQRVAAQNRFNLARSLMEAGRLAEALEILEGLIAKTPRSNAVAAMLIEAYLLCARYQDAQILAERFVAEQAEMPLGNMTLGRIELAQRRPKAALVFLQQAGQSSAGNPRVHAFTGQAYRQLRRWPEARAAFQRALELESDHAEALHGLSIVCLKEKRAQDAEEYARSAINSYEPMPAAHYHLGIALAALGRYSEAALAWERALALDPDFRAARRCLARLCEREFDEPARAAEHRRLDEQSRRIAANNRNAVGFQRASYRRPT
jgi:tetratricopeptide (TPR) repeat protein